MANKVVNVVGRLNSAARPLVDAPGLGVTQVRVDCPSSQIANRSRIDFAASTWLRAYGHKIAAMKR